MSLEDWILELETLQGRWDLEVRPDTSADFDVLQVIMKLVRDKLAAAITGLGSDSSFKSALENSDQATRLDLKTPDGGMNRQALIEHGNAAFKSLSDSLLPELRRKIEIAHKAPPSPARLDHGKAMAFLGVLIKCQNDASHTDSAGEPWIHHLTMTEALTEQEKAELEDPADIEALRRFGLELQQGEEPLVVAAARAKHPSGQPAGTSYRPTDRGRWYWRTRGGRGLDKAKIDRALFEALDDAGDDVSGKDLLRAVQRVEPDCDWESLIRRVTQHASAPNPRLTWKCLGGDDTVVDFYCRITLAGEDYLRNGDQGKPTFAGDFVAGNKFEGDHLDLQHVKNSNIAVHSPGAHQTLNNAEGMTGAEVAEIFAAVIDHVAALNLDAQNETRVQTLLKSAQLEAQEAEPDRKFIGTNIEKAMKCLASCCEHATRVGNQLAPVATWAGLAWATWGGS